MIDIQFAAIPKCRIDELKLKKDWFQVYFKVISWSRALSKSLQSKQFLRSHFFNHPEPDWDDRKEAQHISLWKASEAFTLKVSFCSLHRLETKFTLSVIYHLTKVLSLGWFTVSVWVCINQLQVGHCQKN